MQVLAASFMPYLKPDEIADIEINDARKYVAAHQKRDQFFIEQIWSAIRWQTLMLLNVHLKKGRQITDLQDLLILPSEREDKKQMSVEEQMKMMNDPKYRAIFDKMDEHFKSEKSKNN